MSETQDSQIIDQSNEAKNDDITPSEIESKDAKDERQIEEKTNIESPEETMLENITDKLMDPNHDETMKRLVKSPSSEETQRQSGECRLLPVLVDLRSSLETNSNPTCATTLQHNDADLSSITEAIIEPKLDINYFHDLCTSDLKTALARLEETLKRVDINALTKYTLTLEPSDKFHLLQLISTLVSNLKKAKVDENEQSRPSPPPPVPPASTRRPRKRGNRHTIGVSSEELASARRWLEQERGPAAVKITLKTLPEVALEVLPLETPMAPVVHDNQKDSRIAECPWTTNDLNMPPRTCDKHIKDAINQKQSLQHKIKENDSTSINLSSLTSVDMDSVIEHWESPLETPLSPHEDRLSYKFNYIQANLNDHTFNNETSKSNKYTAKKSKLKRANTIDIPNYLKMQAEQQKMHGAGGNGLRRPIDISNKVAWNQFCGPQSMNPSPAIPSFQPKTDNDKKFLALITRNNDNQRNTWKNIPPSTAPFKSFNYRQTNSIADKNWKSRFSNIKTAFDKPQSDSSSVSSSPASSVFSSGPFVSRRSSKDFHGVFKYHEENSPTQFKSRNFPKHFEESGDRVALASRRFSATCKNENNPDSRISQPPPPGNPAFTHATTSPFKKFPSSTPKNEIATLKSTSSSTDKPVPSCYLPACATGGLLKAKVKMFDHQAQPQIPQKPLYNSIVYGNHHHHHHHQKILNPVNQSRSFNNEELPMEKLNPNKKIQQFYTNHNQDLRTNGRQKEDNWREKEIQVDVDQRPNDDINHNYQSVAVQTSARSTPKSLPIENLYKPPVAEVFRECYAESENPIYVPPTLKDINYLLNEEKYDSLKPQSSQHLPNVPLHLANEHNVENQDITPDKVITRYTAAIGTLACSSPSLSPEPMYQQPDQMNSMNNPAAIILQDDMHRIQHMVMPKSGPIVLQDDIQRHNMLQLSLIKRIQGEDQKVLLPEPPLIEMNNTQDKINIFEEKSHPVPKINITSPIKAAPPLSFPGGPKSSIIPVDSSDEYLVSCSTRPNRSIVLSKSESWHQLALTGANKPLQHLQVPSPHSNKPPKSSSPSQRLSKHFETSGSNPNIALKKMEEKVQRYFNNSGASNSLDYHQSQQNQQHSSTSSNLIAKSESTSARRSFSPKKMPNTLSRSHTMPHLFDDNCDVDKAFDSLFEETTKDNRY